MTPFHVRKVALATLSALAILAMVPAAHAQTYPVKPVRLVVPYAPGGGSDLFARPLAQKMSELLGQPVIVENRAGATGIIGADHVSKAAPDGYTFLVAFASLYLQPFVSKNVPFDTERDFVPVIAAAKAPNVVVVHPSMPVKSIAELVAWGKANPNKLSYVTAGTGSSQHLTGLFMGKSADFDLTHVAYKGGGPAMNDLLGGQVQMGILIMSTVMPHVEAGKLRALAVSEAVRAKALPNLPTVGESIPGFAMPDIWIGLLAPRGTPAAIVNRINADANKAIQAPDVKPKLESAGYEVSGNTPAEFAQTIRSSIEQYRKATSIAGVRPE